MSDNLNKKSGRAVMWSSITEIIAKVIVPIVNIILARLLEPAAFGAVATINMVITFAEIFSDAGFQKYIIQREFDSDEELDKSTNVAFWTNFGVSSLLVIIIIIFRHQLADVVGSPELGNGIAVASFVILMVAFSSIQMARFKRALDFKSLFFVRIGVSIIPLVVTVPLAVIFRNYWALVIGTLSVNLFNAVALTLRSKWKPRLYYSVKRFKEMFSFAMWTLLESILIWLTTHIDIFIVGKVLNDYYLGIYRTSMTTVNSYISLISSAIIPVLFSTLSRYQGDDIQFRKIYWKFFKYTSMLVLPMSVGIFVFREFVTSILLGAQWNEAAGFIGLWGLMSGITVIFSNFSSEVYRSKGNPKLSMLAQALHISFLVPVVMIFVNMSFSSLYVARSLMRIQFVFVNVLLMRFVYEFKFCDMLKNIIPSLVCSLIMALVGMFLIKVSSSIIWQILSVVACVVTYFTAIIVLFPRTRKEMETIPIIERYTKKFNINCKR